MILSAYRDLRSHRDTQRISEIVGSGKNFEEEGEIVEDNIFYTDEDNMEKNEKDRALKVNNEVNLTIIIDSKYRL